MDMADNKQKSVLVALDESTESVHALKWALQHVVRNGDSVILMYSQPPFPSPRGLDIYENYALQANYIESKRLCQEHKVEVTIKITWGDPRERICQAVVESGADVLIVGKHNHGSIMRFFKNYYLFLFYGQSVSDYCYRNAKCPVVVVRKEEEAQLH